MLGFGPSCRGFKSCSAHPVFGRLESDRQRRVPYKEALVSSLDLNRFSDDFELRRFRRAVRAHLKAKVKDLIIGILDVSSNHIGSCYLTVVLGNMLVGDVRIPCFFRNSVYQGRHRHVSQVQCCFLDVLINW